MWITTPVGSHRKYACDDGKVAESSMCWLVTPFTRRPVATLTPRSFVLGRPCPVLSLVHREILAGLGEAHDVQHAFAGH